MRSKKETGWQGKIIPLAVALVFISPAFFIDEGPRIAYILLMGYIGFLFGRGFVSCLRKGKIDFSILAYLSLYILAFIIIDFNFSQRIFIEKGLLTFLFWIILGSWFFYIGVEGIRSKQILVRGFLFSHEGTIFFSILTVLFSLFILISPFIFS